jgi:TolB-like protein
MRSQSPCPTITFRTLPLSLLLGGALALQGCAPGQLGVPSPSPAEIPSLEAAAGERPGDGTIRIRLGAAYLEAGRGQDALPVLRRGLELSPGDPAGRILLGLAHESQEEWSEARLLYEGVLADGSAGTFQPQVEERLALLRRRELEAEVRRAAAREAEFATAVPPAGTVAVLPLQFGSGDPEYRPLSRALAELVVTGLSQVDRITVLERMRVQLLLDELGMVEAGLVDPETAARSGRILGAARVVQGRLDMDGENVEVLASVVPVGPEVPSWPPPVEEQDALPRLFDLQERLVLALFSSMGIELTSVERDRVTQRPTNSLQALLAFGRALEAEDRGDFAAAMAHYQEAVRIDPGFQAAAAGADRTGTLASTAAAGPPGAGSTQGVPGLPGPIQVLDAGDEWGITATTGGSGIPQGVITPIDRDPLAELLGQESPGSASAILEILLRIPAGG